MQEIFVNEEMAIELFSKLNSLNNLLAVIAFLIAVLLVYLLFHFSIGKG
jgi:hypothetical protein